MNIQVEKKEKKNVATKKECQICLEENSVIEFDCGHYFCSSCLESHLHSEFDEKGKSFLEIPCAGVKCTRKFSQKEIETYASKDTLANYNSVLKTIPQDPSDPKLTIDDFCYEFNSKNLLRHKETGNKFHWVNQLHYDLLGDLIIPFIQKKMISEFKMDQIFLPLDSDLPNHMKNNIFLTPDALTNPNKLMLLIQGSGAVRPGQWARALCINDSLDTGAIFNYLDKAINDGYGIIVFNPNLNAAPKDEFHRPSREEFFIPGKPKPKQPPELFKIPHNSSPTEHTLYVWDQFASKSLAKEIVIVAHSAGGVCTVNLLKNREKEILPRLKAIAFTDSVHWIEGPKHIQQFISKNAINWIQSDKPLDTPEKRSSDGCPCISSGIDKHELTSAYAIESVFKFLKSKTI